MLPLTAAWRSLNFSFLLSFPTTFLIPWYVSGDRKVAFWFFGSIELHVDVHTQNKFLETIKSYHRKKYSIPSLMPLPGYSDSMSLFSKATCLSLCFLRTNGTRKTLPIETGKCAELINTIDINLRCVVG